MAMASLYRRSLPSPPAIDFSSAEGKVRSSLIQLLMLHIRSVIQVKVFIVFLQKIFKEAVQKGTMEGYFSLISYFQTQSEPAFCGLASLSMVLNALDSQRKWKGMYSCTHTPGLEQANMNTF